MGPGADQDVKRLRVYDLLEQLVVQRGLLTPCGALQFGEEATLHHRFAYLLYV